MAFDMLISFSADECSDFAVSKPGPRSAEAAAGNMWEKFDFKLFSPKSGE